MCVNFPRNIQQNSFEGIFHIRYIIGWSRLRDLKDTKLRSKLDPVILSWFWFGWFDSFFEAESSKDSSKSSCYLWKQSIIRQLNIHWWSYSNMEFIFQTEFVWFPCLLGSKFYILNLFVSTGSFVFQIWEIFY